MQAPEEKALPGRRTVDGRRGMERKNVSLDPETITLARQLGDGDLSAGLRAAVRTAAGKTGGMVETAGGLEAMLIALSEYHEERTNSLPREVAEKYDRENEALTWALNSAQNAAAEASPAWRLAGLRSL